MRGVSKGFHRTAVLLVLLTVLTAQGAAARQWRDDPGWRPRFERAKRFIVTVLSRFNIPPGDDIERVSTEPAEDLSRFNIPPG